MGKLFFNLCLLYGLYYLYSTGTLTAIFNGNIPQVGNTCELQGPPGGLIYLAPGREAIKYPYDVSIGFSQRDRLTAEQTLDAAVSDGRILCLADHTKVKILATEKFHLYTCPHRIAKVKVLSGTYSGKQGWVQRENVIDTPMQQFIQAYFTTGAHHLSKELQNCPDPSARDLGTMPVRRRPAMPQE